MKTGMQLIAEERARQIEVKGFDETHDMFNDGHEMAWAAACYAAPEAILVQLPGRMLHESSYIDPWPINWGAEIDRRPRLEGEQELIEADHVPLELRLRCLAKAGALIAAEMDRLMAAAERRGGQS